MIDTKDLDKKTAQDLLRDKQDLLELMKLVATKLSIDVTSGKWLWKFHTYRLGSAYTKAGFPVDYTEKLCKLLDMLEVAIQCKLHNQPYENTDKEKLFLTSMRLIERDVKENKVPHKETKAGV